MILLAAHWLCPPAGPTDNSLSYMDLFAYVDERGTGSAECRCHIREAWI